MEDVEVQSVARQIKSAVEKTFLIRPWHLFGLVLSVWSGSVSWFRVFSTVQQFDGSREKACRGTCHGLLRSLFPEGGGENSPRQGYEGSPMMIRAQDTRRWEETSLTKRRGALTILSAVLASLLALFQSEAPRPQLVRTISTVFL